MKSRLDLQSDILSSILNELQSTPRITSLHSYAATDELLELLEATPIKGAVLHWWLGDGVRPEKPSSSARTSRSTQRTSRTSRCSPSTPGAHPDRNRPPRRDDGPPTTTTWKHHEGRSNVCSASRNQRHTVPPDLLVESASARRHHPDGHPPTRTCSSDALSHVTRQLKDSHRRFRRGHIEDRSSSARDAGGF